MQPKSVEVCTRAGCLAPAERDDLTELIEHSARLRARAAAEPDSYEQILIEWQIEAAEALISFELRQAVMDSTHG